MRLATMRFWMLAGAMVVAQGAMAQALTPAQRAEVQQMIAAERESVRAEVTRVICEEAARENVELPTSCKGTAPAGIQAAAQTPNAEAQVARAPAVTFNRVMTNALGPLANATIDSPVDNGRNRFEFTAGKENNRASLRWNHDVSQAAQGDNKTFSTFSIGFSAPLAEEGDTSLATLDGMGKSSEIAFRYTRMHARLTNPFGEQGIASPAFQAWLKDVGLPADVSDSDVVLKHLQDTRQMDRYPEFREFFIPRAEGRWLYGASARVGWEKFEYTALGTTAKLEGHEEPWAVGVFGARLPNSIDGFYWGGGVEYQESYKAADSVTVCPLPGTDTVLACVTRPYGAPAQQDKLLLSLEARKLINGTPVAMKLTHDAKNDESGIDVPIFLFNDQATGFSSGIRVGWNDTDHFLMGVFFGAAFRMEGNE